MIFDKILKDDQSVLNLIKEFNNSGHNLLLTYFNQHCFNIFNLDKSYRDLIEENFHIYLDGIGIYWALKILKYKSLKKYNASDLNERIIEYFIETKKKVYIIGGNFSELQIQMAVKKGLIIISYKNGFFRSHEDEEIIYEIKRKNPDVIIIGMGVPKQEFFAAKIVKNINGKEIVCVGNFLEFYFGNVRRIPKTFRNLGIEWCYRLLTEPKRLWNRYIFGIPIFIKSVIKLKIKS